MGVLTPPGLRGPRRAPPRARAYAPAAGLALALALASSARPACVRAAPAGGLEAAVAEASSTSGLPASWIRAVIAAESAGDPRALSRAGAMGLMQLTPPVWEMLRPRLGLGPDPFHVRDNVMAGAAYLRQMYDRFGPEGAFPAYHAGPSRYARHLRGLSGLPAETRAYVARVRELIAREERGRERGLEPGREPAGAPGAARGAADWRRSPLFPPEGPGPGGAAASPASGAASGTSSAPEPDGAGAGGPETEPGLPERLQP